MSEGIISSILDRFPALRELSAIEKVHLIFEIDQDLLASEFEEPPEIREMIIEVLESRRREYEANPSSAITLEEFRKRMDALRAERAANRQQNQVHQE